MKRKSVLSALLLGSTLSSLSPAIFADLQHTLASDTSKENQRLHLVSKNPYVVKGDAYTIHLDLFKGSKENKSQFNALTFAMSGTVLISGKDGNIVFADLLGYADGNVLFELARDDEYRSEYLMFSCSSTWGECTVPDALLVFDKTNDQWTMVSEARKFEIELVTK